jgi:hypothetical protein
MRQMHDGTTQVSGWSETGCVQTIFAEMKRLAITAKNGVRAQFRLGLNSRQFDRCPEL